MRSLLEKKAAVCAAAVLVLTALLMLAGCGAEDTGSEDAAAEEQNAGVYEVGYQCTVDPEDVTVLMEKLNDYRVGQGGEPLAWNSEPEDEMLSRAAELAICFSETRLNGEPGQELRRCCFDSYEAPEQWAEELLADASFCEALTDPGNSCLCIGMIQSWTGSSFGALSLYPEADVSADALTDGPAWEADDEKEFRLQAAAEQLNCHGQLMDEEMEPIGAGDMYAGESYYYVILNNDPNNNDYEEELSVGYSTSEDPGIADIDQYGTVTANKAGTTTIEVRPAEQSGIRLQLEVTVQ